MQVGQDPVAGSHGRGRLTVDQDAERISISGQDGLDDPERLIVPGCLGKGVGGGVAVDGDGLVSIAGLPINLAWPVAGRA